MTELEKLEKELLEEIQEEPEIYADTEEFCTINPETRIITVPTSKRILGTESDQETNRLYFKCPKIVGDNVDLSLFSLRINYQNAGNKKDQYLVEDVKEEGDNITFSWLLKRNVTAYKGNVKFILCAVKTTEDGIIKNEWNTTLNTECESLEGMEVDKVAVEEETKDIVEQLIAMMNHSAENAVRAVEEAKAEVDKEVGDFVLKAQQALADVNNAGQAQTERVQTAGNDAVESVKAAQGTATRAVETAKTEAIEAVQTEGTTQAGNVSTEGEKQVQAVRGAAQEIVEDRGQIQENKTGVAKLKEDLKGKLDKTQGVENVGKILEVGSDGLVVPVEKPSGGSGSALIYQKLNQEWNKGMCATNGAPMPDIEGFYIWINMVKGDKYIINGFADNASFITIQMEKGYNQPIWNHVKCQDGSSIVDYNKANVNIENLKIECIKDGILCVNSKLKKDLFKEVKVTLGEVVDMIPTKTSQLQNDSKYVDEEKFMQESDKIKELIPTKTSQLQNDSEFLEKPTVIKEIDKRVGLNKLQIHDAIYGITGSPMQIFKHSIMSSDMNLDVFVKMKNTFNYPRYLLINSLDEGDTVVEMSLTNNNNEMIDTKRITFKGKRPTNPSSRKNILFIGDSRTYSGDMVLEASRVLSGTNGESTTPNSFNLSNYHVVGRRKKKNIDPNVGYEGNSGWTARTYFLWGVKSLTLTVQNTTTLDIGSTYTYQASDGKQATLMIEEVDGNTIICIYPSWSSTSALPSSTSGTLTKASGNGDGNIAFTNYVEGKWSPFLVNGNIDFKRYVDKYCEGQLDCVCVWLGINDLIGIGGNTDKEIDYVINDFIVRHLKNAIEKLFEQYPNCKVLLASEVLPSQNGGLATSVEAQYSSLTKGMNYIIHRTNKAYIELASQYPNKCFYLDNNCQFDAINGYDSTEKQVNLRNPKKEQIGSNNVHPNKYGYWQHADSFVRGIINLI